MILELPKPLDLEIEALKLGRTMTEICREAGVPPGSFHRWKRGIQHPKVDTLEKLLAWFRAHSDLPGPPDAV